MRKISIHGPRSTIHGLLRGGGFTLIEMIVVIVITGIVASAVAVFIKRPVEGYVDAARRAELTDVADTALRRMTRDLRTALPNSIRVDGSGRYIEFLQTSGGGRYRVEKESDGITGNILDFTAPDTSFDVIGALPAISPGDSIVVYNLNSDATITTANAYFGDNRGTDASGAVSTVSFTAPAPGGTPSPFPFASPGKRFHVVQYPVTYHCDLGTGRLRRYWGYTSELAQPTVTLPLDGNSALLATNVTDCGFTYATDGANARTGVVALTLQIEQSEEKVRLFQQVHVSNVP